jgi:hypothetical protein
LTRQTSRPWPAAEDIRRGDWARRLLRSRFGGPLAYLLGFVLVSGLITVAVRIWDGRHDNTTISSVSRKASGALVVSGKGVTLSFPPGDGWVNVPVTPNQLARFIRTQAGHLPWFRSMLSQSGESLIQLTRNQAMLVYRVRDGTVIESCSVTVVAGTAPPGQLVAALKAHFGTVASLHARISLLDFGGRPGALMTYQVARAGQATSYEAAADVSGGPETPIVTVTTLSPASSLAGLRQILPTLGFS